MGIMGLARKNSNILKYHSETSKTKTLDGDEVTKVYKLASEEFTRDVTTFFSISFTMRFKPLKRSLVHPT